MLLELQVNNFAIIDSLHIPFENGFNVLSGETGAGKSVILKSLALLMGEKAVSNTVRTGAEFATVEGAFDVGSREDIMDRMIAMGLEVEEQTLVVKRVVCSHGRSRVYLNGSLSTLSNLRDIVSPLVTVTGYTTPLVEMTGQHDNRHLQSKAYHLDVLDQYSGIRSERDTFSDEYRRLGELQKERELILSASQEREQKLDFLKYQIQEIEDLDLQPNEDTEILERFQILKHASKLTEFATQAERTLDSDEDSALIRVHRVLQRASELEKYAPSLKDKLTNLEQAKALLEEACYDIKDFSAQFDSNPRELDEIENRLTQIKRLQKKHGATVEEIFMQLEDMKYEVSTLETSDERLDELNQEIARLHLTLKAKAETLHGRRTLAADQLANAINDELSDLNMKGVRLIIEVAPTEMTSTGTSLVEFRTQNHKDDTPKPLSKFASGGELSRILLSLKKVVGNSELPRTYLFDEVDAGVSGLTAEKVGKKLKSIASGQQVICVTHLPQVAAFADTHFLIEKKSSDTHVNMSVNPLSGDSQVNEIARLISGEKITKTSLDHARQLLQGY